MNIVSLYLSLAIGAVLLYLLLHNGTQSQQIISALGTSNTDAIRALQGR